LRKFASNKGYEIAREFVDEAESARTANRPAFQEMIAHAKSKSKPFEVVLVWKLSRFARNREDSIIYKSLLKRNGVRVESMNEHIDDSPAGVLFEGIIEVIDEFYSANLSQDTKRGLIENAQRGFCNGGIAPIGYKRKIVKDGSASRSVLVPDTEYVQLIKKIFQLCLNGKGAKEIAKYLNEKSIKTKRGENWSKCSVLYILKNPIYTGTYIYARNRKLSSSEDSFQVNGKFEALISKEIFDKVQSFLSSRSPENISPGRINSNYLLSGLIYCGKCGRAMQGGSAKSGRFHYYGCYNHLRKGKDVCDSKMINCTKIDNAIIDKLQGESIN